MKLKGKKRRVKQGSHSNRPKGERVMKAPACSQDSSSLDPGKYRKELD